VVAAALFGAAGVPAIAAAEPGVGGPGVVTLPAQIPPPNLIGPCNISDFSCLNNPGNPTNRDNPASPFYCRSPGNPAHCYNPASPFYHPEPEQQRGNEAPLRPPTGSF
jgi:hypothetical protein